MSTLPYDSGSDEFDIFGHLLNYQQTEEFKQTAEVRQTKERTARRKATAKGAKVYRAKHPEFVRMRAEAQKHKAQLFASQHGICRWCCLPMTGKYQVDHIKPLVKGGTNDLFNLCVCHPRCNQKKGAKEVKQLRLF